MSISYVSCSRDGRSFLRDHLLSLLGTIGISDITKVALVSEFMQKYDTIESKKFVEHRLTCNRVEQLRSLLVEYEEHLTHLRFVNRRLRGSVNLEP